PMHLRPSWALALSLALGLRASAQTQQPPTTGQPGVGYTPADAAAEASEEARAITIPSPAQADSFSHFLSYEPHMAGTPGQARTRDFVIAQLKKWGLETEVRAYDVYMPQPKAIHVWRLNPGGDSTELSLAEGPVPGDSTSSAFPQVPAFNAY